MAFLYFTPLLLPWCACSSRAMISNVVRLMEQVSTIFEFAKTKIYCTTWLAAILSYDVYGRVECKKKSSLVFSRNHLLLVSRTQLISFSFAFEYKNISKSMVKNEQFSDRVREIEDFRSM